MTIHDILRNAPDLTSSEKLILSILSSHAGRKGACWPAQGTIASEAGLCRKTVWTALKRLEALGLVKSENRKRPDGGETSKVYKLRSVNTTPLCKNYTPPCVSIAHPPVYPLHTEKKSIKRKKEETTTTPPLPKFPSFKALREKNFSSKGRGPQSPLQSPARWPLQPKSFASKRSIPPRLSRGMASAKTSPKSLDCRPKRRRDWRKSTALLVFSRSRASRKVKGTPRDGPARPWKAAG